MKYLLDTNILLIYLRSKKTKDYITHLNGIYLDLIKIEHRASLDNVSKRGWQPGHTK